MKILSFKIINSYYVIFRYFLFKIEKDEKEVKLTEEN
jgi:hypothetical protein